MIIMVVNCDRQVKNLIRRKQLRAYYQFQITDDFQAAGIEAARRTEGCVEQPKTSQRGKGLDLALGQQEYSAPIDSPTHLG